MAEKYVGPHFACAEVALTANPFTCRYTNLRCLFQHYNPTLHTHTHSQTHTQPHIQFGNIDGSGPGL